MTREEYTALRDAQLKEYERLRQYVPNLKEQSGIYVYTREVGGQKYAYVGQAVNMAQRLLQHDKRYDSHIDKSIKAHGYWSKDNPNGWKISVTYYDKKYLDDTEKSLISTFGKTHILYNVTAGGQGQGKTYLQPPAPRKGYREGVQAGKRQLVKEINKYLKRLEVHPKSSGVLDMRAWEKFLELVEESDK